MLNLIGSLERPTSGTVRVAGVDTATMTDRQLSALRAQRIGFVFQQFFLLDHQSALENAAMGLLYRGVPGRQRRAAAQEALDRVGLGARAAHRPSQLSGGERQRAAIARAIIGAPDLVLADEPTGNLDTATGAQVVALLASLAGPSTTVLVITHDADVAAAMRRRLRLRDGRIVGDTGAV